MVDVPCKIALSLQNELEKELEKMVGQGIIAPVEGHSSGPNSLVIRDSHMVDEESALIQKTSARPSK